MTASVFLIIIGIIASIGLVGWFFLHMWKAVGPRKFGLLLAGFAILSIATSFFVSQQVPYGPVKTPFSGLLPEVPQPTQAKMDETLLARDENYKQWKPLLKEGADQLTKNPECPALRWRDISPEESTEQEPVFFYTCDSPKRGIFNVMITKSEIERAHAGNATHAIVTPYDENKAAALCEDFIQQQRAADTKEITTGNKNTPRIYANGKTHLVWNITIKTNKDEEKYLKADCTILPNGKLHAEVNER
jgi:hypothetical protein